MQPIHFSRFREILHRLGSAASRHPDTVIDQEGRDTVYYVPFEHVRRSARLVLVGIIPGPTQIVSAYRAAQNLLKSGKTDEDTLAAIKREAAFGGDTMRPNLVRMLDAFGFAELLGIRRSEDLWGNAADLLQSTSVVPHAAFRSSKPFAGSFKDILRAPALRRGFDRDFLPSLQALQNDALYVALGPTPLTALDWCVAEGRLREEQILGALAHPSTNSGSQVDIYLGIRDPKDLKAKDPVRHRVEWLLGAAGRMRASTRALSES